MLFVRLLMFLQIHFSSRPIPLSLATRTLDLDAFPSRHSDTDTMSTLSPELHLEDVKSNHTESFRAPHVLQPHVTRTAPRSAIQTLLHPLHSAQKFFFLPTNII